MSTSAVDQLRKQIQAEYEAAERGLYGFASGTARHAFITAKTENISRYHEALTELVGAEAAIVLLAETIWPPKIQEGSPV